MSGAIVRGEEVTSDRELSCDVCVVGSGAGGAVLAAGLVAEGANVVMLEEGGHHTRQSFTLKEADAYPRLYQERMLRATSDLAISILQGRAVGGSTTVNWTTCFRTPERILKIWRERFGLEALTEGELTPHFEAVEARLHVVEWPGELVNANNRVLRDGCEKLGLSWEVLRRNVNGCVNSGYCGMGCPVDGKQSMLVTYLPDAVARGLLLHADTRATRVELDGARVRAIHAEVLDSFTGRPSGRKLVVRPKVAVLAGGAINTPALLLRSDLGQGGLVGRRTFLHPVVATSARMPFLVEGWSGAPQSIGSHAFIDRGPGEYGFFLETPPIHPLLASTAFAAFGAAHQKIMEALPRTQTLLAIHVDGLLPGDDGGTVTLRADGRPKVDYPISPALARAFHTAMDTMMRIQLAAGAELAMTMHTDPVLADDPADLVQLGRRRYGALEHSIFTAHQLGGAPMGTDPGTSVVDVRHRHHRVPNLFIVDGSVLPTALGVNPSETIYGLAHRARRFVADAIG